ncbi:hypothetical protein F5Y12DRAFT_781623 [Xylaria sp. FL1777]|nr:hypothetical protein F5Y12DRAFT_781623 [Xylaria sp. FL1777]
MIVNGTSPGNPPIHDYPHPLKVAVIGAGIGGLSAAIALRRQGHEVELYEQSESASEMGAAVHLAPNSNGVLRRWGLLAETFGATSADGLIERSFTGEVIRDVDLTAPNKMWQHPWHLVHRVALHSSLKEAATSKAGPGIPAVIRNASKAVDVDADAGIVTLEDGTSITADMIIGADGVYSRTRRFVHGKQPPRLFSSGKAAFRFLLQKKIALEDPLTAPLVEKDNVLTIWYGADRRVVMYPCNHNETLNFVCIHPDSESHATQHDAWDKQGSIEQALKVFEDFDPGLKRLISKVGESDLKVWELLDMEKLPSWTRSRLALLGDAAHPFTPHQGQGAGQAIEDAAALGTVFPKGTRPSDVPERLRLYESIRYERAHMIQEYSRQAGKDWIKGKPQIEMMSYTAYNFGHDEIDNSANMFKRWLLSKYPTLPWRIPLTFSTTAALPPPSYSERTFITASVKFKTSRTYLETLFPTSAFRFRHPATVCTASISATTFGDKSWPGAGGGYDRCGLYIPGVEYTRQDGSSIVGTYLAVLFADPVASDLDELGMGKVHCQMDVTHKPDSYRLVASWRGIQFFDLKVDSLETGDLDAEDDDDVDYSDILTYRYIPAVGQPGKADAEYACVIPRARAPEVKSVQSSTKAAITFDAGDWQTLPTLHHVASGLAEMPIYDIVGAKVIEGSGVVEETACWRIE